MFNSKSFAIVIVLTLLSLGAVVTLQFMEMQEYNLVDKLYRKYFSPASITETTDSAQDTRNGDKSVAPPASSDESAAAEKNNDADSTTENP